MGVTMLRESGRKASAQRLAVSPALSLPRKRMWSAKTAARLLTILAPVLLGVILLGSWYISTSRGLVAIYELPPPSDVWTSLQAGLASGLFLHMAWVTLQESLGGFLLAVALALPVGYSLAKWRLFAATVYPYLAAGQAIPAIVIAPFLVVWMGYGMGPTVVLCLLVVLFPMVITTALGFQTLDQVLVDAARVEGASLWPMLSTIEFPLALPAIMAAVRTGLTLSVVGALVGEFVTNTDQGLGALVQIAKNQYDVPLMFATVLVLAVIAALFYGVTWGLTRLSQALTT
ncbi:MAG TPA: ABC transporter permease [Ktedonobacteraceae bacterium]